MESERDLSLYARQAMARIQDQIVEFRPPQHPFNAESIYPPIPSNNHLYTPSAFPPSGIVGGSIDFVRTYDHLAFQTDKGIATESYGRMLKNRIYHHLLNHGGRLDIRKYHPIFIFDMLMLPGSLASAMGKDEMALITDRMTPAMLPGFQTRTNPTTGKACLLHTGCLTDVVHGVVIFGQGKNTEAALEQQYSRDDARSTKVWIIFESLVSPPADVFGSISSMLLQRCPILATTFVWSGLCDGAQLLEMWAPWNIEDCVSGKYQPADIS